MSRGALRAMFRPYVEFDFTRMAFDTRVSFSRSSTGTYFDPAGVMQTASSNVPRKTHNPATGAVRGLLVEEQRTNLLLRSQELDAAEWAKPNALVTANAAVAPDGTTSADKLVENAATSTHDVRNTEISVAVGDYTASLSAKSAERSWVRIAFGGIEFGGQSAYFNVSSGAIGTVFGTGAAASIHAMPNGWFRCALTAPADTAGSSGDVYFQMADADSSPTYAGDGASGIYIWGVQLEAGSYPTSYIPTTAATVTRSADVATCTIPPRVVRLVTIYDDGTTSQQTVTPGASYTIPTGQKPILRIRGYFA